MTGFEIVTALLRGIHLAAALSLLGCLVFQRFVMPVSEPAWRAAVTRIAEISGGLAVVFGAAWLAAVAGTMADATNLETLLGAVPLVARGTSFGNLVCLRLVLLAGAVFLLVRQYPLAQAAALLAAAVALGLQPLLGHIGALPGATRLVLIPIEIAHLLAAGSWLGGLFPLLYCVMRAPPKLAAQLCERFTPVGLVAVGTIAITALPQAGELIGGLPGLFGTEYGHMALVKLGLFSLALGLACVNRLVLTTRLVSPRRATARTWLIGSVAIEAMAVLGVVLAAAAMASSAPAAHVQPVWPFAWRPSLAAWNEPALRAELLRPLVAGAIGLALLAGSFALRRFRMLAAIVAVVVVAPFAPSLSLLLVEAFPTSYARSTTGFSVAAIVRGETLFGEHCAVCHDQPNGTGGDADLTAPHLWEHLDGELYWAVSNGVVDPEGDARMPGFGSVLSAEDRWSLIDFIRARNVGAQMRKTGTWSPPVAAPATPLICAGSDADSLADLSGHVLLVIADGDTATVPTGEATAVTIALARGETGTPKPRECVTASATAWQAWAVLAGVAPDAFAGYQAIVDGQGWLRAWLSPAAGPERVRAAIADAHDHQIPGNGAAEVAHHH